MQSKIDIKCPLPRDIFYCKCFFKKAEKKPGEPNPTLESYALDQGRKVTLRKLRVSLMISSTFLLVAILAIYLILPYLTSTKTKIHAKSTFLESVPPPDSEFDFFH